MDKDVSPNPHMWWISCAHPLNSHTHSYQTLQSCQLISHYTCCSVSKALSGYCWKGKQGRECPDTKVWAMSRRPGWICFTMSSCERTPSGCPQSTPSAHRSSRLSAVLNGPWEFLTTIWLAPLQRALWPAWKHFHTHTHKHAKNSTSIHHKDIWKGNWKWQAVSSGLILSNLYDLVCYCWHRNTLRLFLDAVFVQKFSKIVIFLALGVRNSAYIFIPVVCNRDQSVFYLVSITTHCFITVTTHSQGAAWVYRPESKPSLSCLFPSYSQSFHGTTIGNDTQLQVIKLPPKFLSLLDSLFSFPPDDTARSLMFFCLSLVSREKGRGTDVCIFDSQRPGCMPSQD